MAENIRLSSRQEEKPDNSEEIVWTIPNLDGLGED